jgi:hypothetical protein
MLKVETEKEEGKGKRGVGSMLEYGPGGMEEMAVHSLAFAVAEVVRLTKEHKQLLSLFIFLPLRKQHLDCHK